MTKLRRLSWAGIELRADRARFLLDPLENVEPLVGYQGRPHDRILHIEADGPAHALVTHRHPDHFDPMTLKRLVGASGTVFCPRALADEVECHGLRARGMDPWERAETDGVTVAAVPAVDWRGDEQVSWVLDSGDQRIIHCGDTLFHGQWWRIAREWAPFDWAFLPINGVVAIFPGLDPSGLPATLTPKQACVAARLLRAKSLCPIHYRTFNNPPAYAEQPHLMEALVQASLEEGINVRRAEPGESLA